MKRAKGTYLALVTVLLSPMVAQADLITWDLVNVFFNDGNSLSGSFIFDADSGLYSDVSITSSATSVTYGDSDQATVFGLDEFGLNLIDNFGLADLAGQSILNLDFLSALTNSGGIVGIVAGFPSFEGTCGSAACTSGVINRTVLVGGEVVARVPEPGTLALFGIGLAALGLSRRRRQI